MARIGKSFFATVVLLAVQAQAGQVIRFSRATLSPQDMKVQSVENFHEMIVQYKDAVVEKDKEILKAKGLKVLGYLPDDALVVTGNLPLLRAPGEISSRISGVLPYYPELKISASIASLTTSANQMERWFVSTFNSESLNVIVEKIKENSNFRLLTAAGRTAVVLAKRSDLKFLAALPGVEHVQADPRFESLHMKSLDQDANFHAQENEPLAGTETGTKAMNFDSAWAKGFTGRGQVASFADTGLDSGDLNNLHADFKGAIRSGQALGLFGKSWEDPMGHGTHVAGSIAGRGSFSNGQLKGGAFEAAIVAQSMWSPMMDNIVPPSKLSILFDKALQEGAAVHSDSWGSPRDLGAYDGTSQQVDDWIFNHPDLTILFAAGNSGVDDNHDGRIDANSIGAPATAKNCISVGASENVTTTGGIQVPISKLRSAKDHWATEPILSSFLSDNINGVAMFSSRGPTKDGRIKPDIVAPGTNILSTKSQHPKAQDLWGKYNSHYVWSGGTSMATPLAAGAVTVARQFVVEKMGIKNPSSALMKAVMVHSAVDMFPGQYGEVGASKGQEILNKRPNSDEGYGRVDLENITSMDSKTRLVDERQGVGVGEEKEYSLTIGVGAKLLANLVYSDAPGSPNAAQALVNDLDLILIKPDGTRFAPQDKINNLEVIEIAALPPGNYKLVVRGANVPQGLAGKQPFALIWTAQ